MAHLRDRLIKEKEIGRGVIVSYGLGEVNTGGIGGDLEDVAELCDELGAWLHVDAGMFPLVARLTKKHSVVSQDLDPVWLTSQKAWTKPTVLRLMVCSLSHTRHRIQAEVQDTNG